MQKNQKLLGFTLVELIVVITIVGILSTVGFVSYSGYLTGARDSNRISQLTKLSDSLQVYSATKSLPLPDDYIEVTASGTVIGYQGYVGVDVLETIDFTNGGKDPKDDGYYTYYLSKDRNSLQLLALMEEQGSVAKLNANKAHAATYEDRYPKVYGKKLGVLTQVDTNTPAQEVTGVTTVDIVTTTDNYVSHISDTEKLEGAGAVLQAAIPNGSCKRIKQMGKGRGNGTYTINPGGEGEISIYCDMENDGGGWTLVAGIEGANRNHSNSLAVTSGNLSSVIGKGKLSDATINTIADSGDSAYRLICIDDKDYFNGRGVSFISDDGAQVITSAYDTYSDLPTSGNGIQGTDGHRGVDAYNEGSFGVNGLSYAHGTLLGCLNNLAGANWGNDGTLWVR